MCFLSPCFSLRVIMLVAVLITLVLFGYLNSCNMQQYMGVPNCTSYHVAIAVLTQSVYCINTYALLLICWDLSTLRVS